MKFFSWNDEKNLLLKAKRNITFEEVVFFIEKGKLLDILEHPNQERYQGQKLFVVDINDYAYLVPFLETEETIFLITIIPSRKATRDYIRGEHE